MAAPRPQGDLQVLGDREARQDVGNLEAARDADVDARMRRQARDVLAVEPDAPGARRQLARQLRDQGRLAGAVGPDDGVRLAMPHREVEVIGGDHAAERLRETFGA